MSPISSIMKLFGESPIRPLQRHMKKAHASALLLIDFFEAVFNNDWEHAHVFQQKIAHLEQEADQLKKEVRLHLPKSLFLPVPRSDLLEMLTLQDRLSNKARDIAGLVLGRRMKIPDPIRPLFSEFLQRSLDASLQAKNAIDELDELLETGFRGAEVTLVEEMIIELDSIEQMTDELQVQIRDILFNLEKEYPPIDMIFLYKIIEWVGSLANHADDIGNQLELLLAQ